MSVAARQGSRLMQVHHVVPVEEFNEDYELDPVPNLVSVRGNCHIVIHSREPASGGGIGAGAIAITSA